MKLLCFQAKRFHWKTHTKSLAEVADQEADEHIAEAIIVFIHAEKSDAAANRKTAVLRQTLKHIKWLANKRNFKNIVLHSFTHLGAETAPADFAEALIETVAARLRENAYRVWTTPFGYFCEWDLSVYGDSLAKVWKEIH